MSSASRLERPCRWLAWVCAAVLAVLSLAPADHMVRTGFSGRLEHFVAYAGTAAVAVIGYRRQRTLWSIAAMLCLYAALLEIGQNWVAGREARLIDFAMSAAGSLTGVALALIWLRSTAR